MLTLTWAMPVLCDTAYIIVIPQKKLDVFKYKLQTPLLLPRHCPCNILFPVLEWATHMFWTIDTVSLGPFTVRLSCSIDSGAS